MKVAIILVGVPGSGKSTAASNMRHIDVFCYSTDDLIEQYAKSINSTYDKQFKQYFDTAKQQANEELLRAIEYGKHIVWDQTNLSASKRISILKKIPDDYIKECLAIQPPSTDQQLQDIYARLNARCGKTISPDLLESMVAAYEEPSISEGFKRITITDIYGNIIKVRQ